MSSRISKDYKYFSAIMAFILWGGWAFYVNSGSGISVRIIAGLVQGSASLIITLVMIKLVTAIFHRLPDNPLRIILAAFITVSITGSGLMLAHSVANTPRIIATISPALTVAFVFCLYTALKLHRLINN